MARRTVKDVMTRDVVTVWKGSLPKDAARLMVRHRIGGLPVIDVNHHVIGVVSATDLLHKRVGGRHGNPLGWPLRRWRPRIGSTGRRVLHFMTAPAVTTRPDASLESAARMMDKHGVTRLPVVDAKGTLLGIVSQRDLMRAFTRPDDEIAREISADVFDRYLGTNPALVHVVVQDGVVTLAGEVTQRSMIPTAVEQAGSVDGVIDVREHLTYAVDDTQLPHTVNLVDY